MNKSPETVPHQRYLQVLRYIESHLDQPLSVAELSRVAGLSKYHFHRRFHELFGINLCHYIRQLRLKRASFQLAFRLDHSVTDIAFNAGYENAESFSRAFKKSTGHSPSAFRQQPVWPNNTAACQTIKQARVEQTKMSLNHTTVTISEFPETRLAVMEHRGAPERLGDTIRRFIAWRKQNKLSPRVSDTYNLAYHDPAQVKPEDYRFGLGVSVTNEIEDTDAGITTQVIPSSRCAVLRHSGSDDSLGESVRYLYQQWLPESDYQPRHFPILFKRLTLFPDVPEQDMQTDIIVLLE